MKTDPAVPTAASRIPTKARQALAKELRDKKQRVAPILVEIDGAIFTFTYAGWIDYCQVRAQNEHAHMAAHDGRLLAFVFARITTWVATDFGDHLCHLDHLEHQTSPMVDPSTDPDLLKFTVNDQPSTP